MKNENTITARAQWDGMTPAEQLEALKKMTWTAHRKEPARGEYGLEWIETPADAEQVATEAWPDVFAQFDRLPAGSPLAWALYRAVRNRARIIGRAERQHVRGSIMDAEKLDRVYRYSTAHAADRIPGPEAQAIFSDSLRTACKDATDAAIIKARAEGMTQAEIAAALGISQPAIVKRLAAIRSRFHAAD